MTSPNAANVHRKPAGRTDGTAGEGAGSGRRRGLTEKRRAIIDGATTVFGRDGYTRAGIDSIAKEAGVSTRTIYNHFANKEELFVTVIEQSAAQVRDAQLADIERHLGKIVDLEADLVALGRAFTRPLTRFDAHFALVRQIHAEAGHLSPQVIEAWRNAGSRRVQSDLARRLGSLGDRGLLDITDPDQAASHFVQLAGTEVLFRTLWGVLPISQTEIDAIVTGGVRAFLRAYRR